MTIFIKDMPMEEVFNKIGDLTNKHWEEIANNKDKIKLNPNKDQYKILQEMGSLANAVAIENDKLIGYIVVFLSRHIHYQDDVFAYVDVIYVDPDYRNSSIGLKLISLAEELAEGRGASLLSHHCKPDHPALEKILLRKGYKLSESILSKVLKE